MFADHEAAGTPEPLSAVVERLRLHYPGIIDRWLGKRRHPRQYLALPVQAQVLDNKEQSATAPPFTAQSRDISEQGIGISIGFAPRLSQYLQLTLLTDLVNWAGQFRVVRCAHIKAGYAVGMQCVAPSPSESTKSATEAAPSAAQEVLSSGQIRYEILQAMERYRMAELSRGKSGIPLRTRIRNLISAISPPARGKPAKDPHRRSPRYEVDGEVHAATPRGCGLKMLASTICNISETGARLTVCLDEDDGAERELTGEAFALRVGMPLAIGVWMEESGTLWLPGRVVHYWPVDAEAASIGVEFIQNGPYTEFR